MICMIVLIFKQGPFTQDMAADLQEVYRSVFKRGIVVRSEMVGDPVAYRKYDVWHLDGGEWVLAIQIAQKFIHLVGMEMTVQ